MRALENSKKSHGTKFLGFSNFMKFIKTFLLYANFHICPLKNNHLKFRQIQNVTMWTGTKIFGLFLMTTNPCFITFEIKNLWMPLDYINTQTYGKDDCCMILSQYRGPEASGSRKRLVWQKNVILNMARPMKNSGTLPCMTFTEMAFKGHNLHSKSLNKQ